MNKRTFGSVQKSFVDEVGSAFGFLVSDFGLEGPELRGVALPVVAYLGRGLRYRIMLDSDDMAVITRVDVEVESKTLVAELEDLVQAAGLGARNHVTHSATTLTSLRQTLNLHAKYVKLLHVKIDSGAQVELMQMANAREWNVHS